MRPTHTQQGLLAFFVRHKVAANILMVLMILSGVFALTRLNTQFLPTFHAHYIFVEVAWPAASAEDIEEGITAPLELVLRTLDNLHEMRSVSRQGFARITLEFKQKADMSRAMEEVRQAISQAQDLPKDAEPIKIREYIPYEDIAKIIISGPKNLEAIRHTAYRIEQDLLDRGIAKITLQGLPERDLSIDISSQTLSQLNLSLNDIAQKVNANSHDAPLGIAGKQSQARQLRALSQQRTPQGFGQLPILSNNTGHVTHLADIAQIKLAIPSDAPKVFYQHKPAVLFKLYRTPNSSTLSSADIIRQWAATAQTHYGQGLNIHVFDERWQYVQQRIDLLLRNGIGGLVLIIAILFITLNRSVAWWVTLGIPISFMASLFVLLLAGGSINMVSLFALIMTLGIIVDDTIVVGEEALTQYKKGQTPLLAVVNGAKRMLQPIMASSLTTVCAFLPLLLIGNIMGSILRAIPIVVISVIVASLFESFLVLPEHLYRGFRREQQKTPSKFRRKFDAGFTYFRDHHFTRWVNACLQHRWTALAALLLIICGTIGLLAGRHVLFNFFPSPPGRLLFVNIQFYPGTANQTINQYLTKVQQSLEAVNKKLSQPKQSIVKTPILFRNQNQPQPGQPTTRGRRYASMLVELQPPDERTITNEQFIETWRAMLPNSGSVEDFSIEVPRSGPPGRDIAIQFRGQNLTQLKAAANELKTALAQYQGVNNIQDNLPYGDLQSIYQLNAQGHALGLTTQDLARQIHAAFSGQIVQRFQLQREEVTVRLRLADQERLHLHALDHLLIKTPQGQLVPLATVATMTKQRGLDSLRRTDSTPVVLITAKVDPNQNNANQIIAQLKQSLLPRLTARYQVSYSLRGRSREQAETFQDMRYGLILGLSLIYLILAFVFASYGWPLLVMIVIPLGLCGAIIGHWLLGINLTILSLFGLFGLSGIVINDSIILLMRYKEIRDRYDTPRQAILAASQQRFRAVLLTSATTIAGLIPLLFERSLQAQFLIPMAVSISFGLAFATILILIVIPILLSIYEDGLAIIRQYRQR